MDNRISLKHLYEGAFQEKLCWWGQYIDFARNMPESKAFSLTVGSVSSTCSFIADIDFITMTDRPNNSPSLSWQLGPDR
ncbi:MAG: hypothetical protein O7G85_04400, partial [Planctomycetota bacterium]|nr:hypothetical protein [Planctomycetota bacterium]